MPRNPPTTAKPEKRPDFTGEFAAVYALMPKGWFSHPAESHVWAPLTNERRYSFYPERRADIGFGQCVALTDKFHDQWLSRGGQAFSSDPVKAGLKVLLGSDTARHYELLSRLVQADFQKLERRIDALVEQRLEQLVGSRVMEEGQDELELSAALVALRQKADKVELLPLEKALDFVDVPSLFPDDE
jgi:hypothetical protein